MIDPFKEKLISFRDLTKQLPGRNGKRLNIATVYRWATAGRRGVVLDSILVGGVRYTSEGAVRRFFAGVSAAENPHSTPTPAQRKRAISKAVRDCESEGL